jgi:hypothetical protein
MRLRKIMNGPVNTVRSGTHLTHTEVKEWDTRQDENDCMKMLTGNESTENVLQGNEGSME